MSEITNLEQNLIIKKIDSETINAQINNNLMLMSIVGQFNQNFYVILFIFRKVGHVILIKKWVSFLEILLDS